MSLRSIVIERPEWADRVVVIYDGECPFCSRYVALQRLRETLGSVDLIDARYRRDLVDAFENAGFPLDDGMALVMHGEIFYGAECVNRLAMLSSRSGAFNKMNAWLFSSVTLSRICYPILKLGRALVLLMLGRGRLTS